MLDQLDKIEPFLFISGHLEPTVMFQNTNRVRLVTVHLLNGVCLLDISLIIIHFCQLNQL